MAVKESPKVKFIKREATGKGACRKLRAKGLVPVVFYGPDYKDSVVGQADVKELAQIANTPTWETTMVNVEMPDGKAEMALMRKVHRHALTQSLLHVDLYQLVKGHMVRVMIPVRVIGKDACPGIKMGGILEHTFREVEIETLPNEIPGEFVVDISKMVMGNEVFMKDLPVPASAHMLTPADTPVVIIAKPKSVAEVEEEEAPAEEETAEVEVVAKGKARKEEEA